MLLVSILQLNQVSSWIDGSFIYSTSEPWVNTMRSFRNGTFSTDNTGKLPVRNSMRVPLFNNPVPHVMKMLSPERLFRKCVTETCNNGIFLFYYTNFPSISVLLTSNFNKAIPLLFLLLSTMLDEVSPKCP